jgi:uncharacterized membrane protein (UPF0127 family)
VPENHCKGRFWKSGNSRAGRSRRKERPCRHPPSVVSQLSCGLSGGAPVRAGDAIVALGYPLSGVLAADANLSVGNVSALAGLHDDSRYLQISAPVQPGNSGGPLLDASGHLVGIVTAKLNALRVARFTGDIPQNVNLAIKAEVARTFLDSKGISYKTTRSDRQLSAADVGDVARPFTVHIECEQIASQSVAVPINPSASLPEQIQPPASTAPTFSSTKLIIGTQRGPQAFTVELALTQQQMAWGISFRHTMPADAGMLYVYPSPRIGHQEMKNTFIPLDVLFINSDGLVSEIFERRVVSDAKIASKTPVRAMLELNGGTVERLGIKPADTIHAVFFNDTNASAKILEVLGGPWVPRLPAVSATLPKSQPVLPKPTKLTPGNAIDWSEFGWESYPFPGYHFTLRNKTSHSISRIKYVVVFYGSDGVPIHSAQGEYSDTILGGLAKTLDDSDSCQNGCLPNGIKDRTARVEIRILDYRQ